MVNFGFRARLRHAAVGETASSPPGARILEKYRIEQEIGRGAFGIVWVARHAELGRRVVLKALRAENRDSLLHAERFRQEARILATIDHPHVTRIYDVEHAGATTFLVMEYVDGGSLHAKLRAGVMTLAETAVVLDEVLDALAHVHARGIVHRDIKPENVLFTAGGRVKLADFGVARDPRAPNLTAPGFAPGTPIHMAPEQFEGAGGDARMDLYAVAELAFEMLTGAPSLWPAPGSSDEIRQRILESDPPLPLRSVGPEMNEWLARGLAKRPEHRFQSAEAMRNALHAAVNG